MIKRLIRENDLESNIDVLSFTRGRHFCSGYVFKDFYVDGAVLIRASTIMEELVPKSLRFKERIGWREGVISDEFRIRQPVGLCEFLKRNEMAYITLYCEGRGIMYWGLIERVLNDCIEINHWDGLGKYMGVKVAMNDDITMVVAGDRYSRVFRKYIERLPNKSIQRRR